MSHESLQGSIQIPEILNIFGTELKARRKLATHTKTVESPVEIGGRSTEKSGVLDKLALLHEVIFKCNQTDAFLQEKSDTAKNLRIPVSMYLNIKF